MAKRGMRRLVGALPLRRFLACQSFCPGTQRQGAIRSRQNMRGDTSADAPRYFGACAACSRAGGTHAISAHVGRRLSTQGSPNTMKAAVIARTAIIARTAVIVRTLFFYPCQSHAQQRTRAAAHAHPRNSTRASAPAPQHTRNSAHALRSCLRTALGNPDTKAPSARASLGVPQASLAKRLTADA